VAATGQEPKTREAMRGHPLDGRIEDLEAVARSSASHIRQPCWQPCVLHASWECERLQAYRPADPAGRGFVPSGGGARDSMIPDVPYRLTTWPAEDEGGC
jgi:hypothetical protein